MRALAIGIGRVRGGKCVGEKYEELECGRNAWKERQRIEEPRLRWRGERQRGRK